MAKIKIEDGGVLYYEVKGEGEPIVLLRGLGRSIKHWLGFDRRLAEHCRVITIDARGIGRSHCHVPWDLTVRHLAEDVILVLDKLGIPKAHVFGVSLGGMIALELGLDFADRVSSITVINSSLAGTWMPRLTPKAIMTLLYAALNRQRLNEMLSGLLMSQAVDPERVKRIIAEWDKLLESEGLPAKTIVKQLLAAARFHVADRLPTITVPTLLIHSDDDRFVPSAHTRTIHSLIPSSELRIVANSSHEPTLDQPDQVCEILQSFVDRHGLGLRVK